MPQCRLLQRSVLSGDLQLPLELLRHSGLDAVRGQVRDLAQIVAVRPWWRHVVEGIDGPEVCSLWTGWRVLRFREVVLRSAGTFRFFLILSLNRIRSPAPCSSSATFALGWPTTSEQLHRQSCSFRPMRLLSSRSMWAFSSRPQLGPGTHFPWGILHHRGHC